ncbi:MAG: PAS domain S-box protein [Desulfobacca sp.]|nr:PAS domain S-box protein [Desulfobacca sp.]
MNLQDYQLGKRADPERRIEAWLCELSAWPRDQSRSEAVAQLQELRAPQIERAAGAEVRERQRVEETLLTQTRVLESMAEGVTVTDKKGIIIYTNPAAELMFGYQPGELIGQPSGLLNHYPPEVNISVVREILATVNSTGNWCGEFRNRKKDGTPFFTSARISALGVGGKKFFISVQEDITARKRVEAEMSRLASFPELNPNPALEIDRYGRVVYANPAAQKWAQDLALAEGLEAFVPPNIEDLFQAARDQDLRHYSFDQTIQHFTFAVTLYFPEAFSTARLYAVDITERQQAEAARQKAYDELERRVAERTAALRLANEQLLWEIEERQQIEAKLRESETRFAAFMKHLPGAAVMRDLEGRYIFANATWENLAGQQDQAWLGKTPGEVWLPELAEKFEELDAQVIATQEPQEGLETLELTDGRHYLLVYRFPIMDQTSLPDMVGGIAIDITKRVEAEAALKEQSRLMEAFFAYNLTPFVLLDAQFNFLRVNQAYARACQREVSEFIGRNHFELYPSEAQQIFEAVVRNKEPYQVSARPFTFPDHPEWGITYWDWTLTPILDHTGEVDFLVYSLQDVTKRRQAELEVQRRSSIVNGINRILREALRSESEAELGQTCLAVAQELTDSRAGFIYKINHAGKFEALARFPGGELGQISTSPDLGDLKNLEPLGLFAESIREGKSIITDVATGAAPAGLPPWSVCLGVPLLYGGQTIGLIGLGDKSGGYTPADQEAVEALGVAIVEALWHHAAKVERQESERKLRYLADQLITIQEQERKRLAIELHDELGQALLTFKLSLRSIENKLPPEQEQLKEEIRASLAYINEVIEEVRRLYHDLSPGDLENLGLTIALRNMIEEFAACQPQIFWEVDLPNLDRFFPLPVQTTIYRVFQEALTNIGKHAQAAQVQISAKKDDHHIVFTIQDDGRGFSREEVLHARRAVQGLGLVAMEERLKMVGSTLKIWSREQEGVRISFTIPILPEGERP